MSAQSHIRGPAKQVIWMVTIWALSVLCLGVIAMAFRFIMSLAGMTA